MSATDLAHDDDDDDDDDDGDDDVLFLFKLISTNFCLLNGVSFY